MALLESGGNNVKIFYHKAFAYFLLFLSSEAVKRVMEGKEFLFDQISIESNAKIRRGFLRGISGTQSYF